ncbi:MAG: hypothetical protein E7236_01230 [Lachnospiraceae bacterium]|nr:hypothetical protein [Lachnospiraceae bacterium]
MYDSRVVLCAASAYDKKYYLNPQFDGLPQGVKEDLQIMCVLFTEDVGGILSLYFDEDGSLQLETDAAEEDLLYDEIGSALKIKQMRSEKRDLLEGLEMYYQIFK